MKNGGHETMNETIAEAFKKRRIATHEAGHAVMHIILGVPFTDVSLHGEKLSGFVIQDGKKIPATAITGGGVNADEKTIQEIDKNILSGTLDIRQALASMAGPVAEAKFIGRIDAEAKAGAHYDMETITLCCRAAFNRTEDLSEWKAISKLEERIVDAFAIGTEELLKENWGCVKAVADALLEKETLSYLEALAIAEANGLEQ